MSAQNWLAESELCRGLSPDDVSRVAAAGCYRRLACGDVICRQGETGRSMYLVASGQLRVTVERAGGSPRLLGYLGRGAHFGEMALFTDGRRTATVTSVIESDLLEIEQDDLQNLLTSVPALAANLCRTLGHRLHSANIGRTPHHVPATLALVHRDGRASMLTHHIATALVERGNAVKVLTSRMRDRVGCDTYQWEEISPQPSDAERVAAIHERLARGLEAGYRILLELRDDAFREELVELLALCEQVWWLVEPADAARPIENLRALVRAAPAVAQRIHLVWILREADHVGPRKDRGLGIAEPDFKVPLGDDGSQRPPSVRRAISRLVRHLYGVRLGLALGGGGARGLAHLGVLRVLEREGIYFDLIAGTSSGAMMGLSHASGYEPEESVENFRRELTPPRILSRLPRGSMWYLGAMFRLGAWERKLRRYFDDWTFDQLLIPLSTMSVDLITGEPVARERGDAVAAILESINLPMISRPIHRDGMALVDGGILNNLPADVLIERGAELVVGVDVVAKLPQRFAGNVATTPARALKRASAVATLLRVTEVQAYGMTAVRSGTVDLMIRPDTSAFDFSDFSSARQLAETGEIAAEEALPQLKRMLADFGA